MQRIRRRQLGASNAICVGLGFVFCTFAHAGMPIVLTQSNGERTEAIYRGIDDAGKLKLTVDEDSSRLAIDGLRGLSFAQSKKVTQADADHSDQGVMMYSRGGSVFSASIVSGDSKQAVLATRYTDSLVVPYSQMSGIRWLRHETPAAKQEFDRTLTNPDTTEDKLLILRDDRVTVVGGVLESLSDVGGTFRYRGRSVPLQMDRTYGIVFAEGVGEAARSEAICRTIDEQSWAGALEASSPESVRVALAWGETITLPVEHLSRIEFRSANAVYLSDLEPVEYVFEPFGVTRWGYRMDRSVANRPIRLGDRLFEHGIGMHSQSRLTFAKPPEARRFATTIGIDEAVTSHGSVVFRVLADGEEVFDSGQVEHNDEPKSVDVEIGKAQQITLVVEFGDGLDIGDQANWADARFIIK